MNSINLGIHLFTKFMSALKVLERKTHWLL